MCQQRGDFSHHTAQKPFLWADRQNSAQTGSFARPPAGGELEGWSGDAAEDGEEEEEGEKEDAMKTKRTTQKGLQRENLVL